MDKIIENNPKNPENENNKEENSQEYSYDSEEENQKEEELKFQNYLSQITKLTYKNFLNTALKLKKEEDYEEASLILKALIIKGGEIYNSEMNINLYDVYFHLGDSILAEVESRPEDVFGSGMDKKKKELGDKFGDQEFALKMMGEIMQKYNTENLDLENAEFYSNDEEDDDNFEEGAENNQNEVVEKNGNEEQNGDLEQNRDVENNGEEENGDEEKINGLEHQKILDELENNKGELNNLGNNELNELNNNEKQMNEEEIEELQVAWENIESSRAILQKYLNEQKNLNKKDKEYFLRKLSHCYLRLGDIENRKENFKEGIIEYKNSLEVLRGFEDEKKSRRMAEIYFLLGNSYIYEFEDNALENGLECYKKGKSIISILYNEEKLKNKNKNENLIKELKDLVDIFSVKILEVEEEMGMTDNIEKSTIKEMMKKESSFPNSAFGENVKVQKLGKFSSLKKKEGSDIKEVSRKKIK